MLVNFIKNRGETSATPDFKTKLFPAYSLLIKTGHKLLKGYEQQTVLLGTSLEAMASINSMPNEIRIAIA